MAQAKLSQIGLKSCVVATEAIDAQGIPRRRSRMVHPGGGGGAAAFRYAHCISDRTGNRGRCDWWPPGAEGAIAVRSPSERVLHRPATCRACAAGARGAANSGAIASRRDHASTKRTRSAASFTAGPRPCPGAAFRARARPRSGSYTSACSHTNQRPGDNRAQRRCTGRRRSTGRQTGISQMPSLPFA